jgi:Calx-beta domain-containing protein
VIVRSVKNAAGRLAIAAALILPSFAVVAGIGAAGHVSGPLIPGDLDGSASAQTTGIGYSFSAPPIAPAGSLGPSQSVTFILKVKNNGVADPGGPVYLSYNSPAVGDATTVPAAQCAGTAKLSRTPVLCTANSSGQIALTYTAPAQPPAQDVVLFTAGNTASNPSVSAVNHYLYATNYRFTSSPIATPGSLAANASVAVTLSAENAADQGIPNDTVDLSFVPTAGGGSARITGGAALTKTPTLYRTNSSGLLSLTYTAPASRPATGIDSIVVQDLAKSPQVTNSDSYAFSASAPVISIGDSTIVEGDVQPGTPADFTVTIQPVQATATTVQYTTLCGIGDKGCEEDYVQVLTPATITIPAHASSAKILLRQFAYIGGNAGETYAEGWYIHLTHPSAGVLGRSVGEGVLLPDLESGANKIADLYAGGAGLVPTPGSNQPMYFTVTLGAPLSAAVTFHYATSDGSAVAGRDYVAASGTASIAAGSTSAVIPVTLLANAPPSASRTFTFTISGASGGVTIYTATGTGTVLAG